MSEAKRTRCPGCGEPVIKARSLAQITCYLDLALIGVGQGNGRAVAFLEDGIALFMGRKDKRLGHRAHKCEEKKES